MSNYPYFFIEPSGGIRKGIVDAHAELAKLGKTIYVKRPKKISLYLSFKHRGTIRNFFNKTLVQIETFSEIERLKKLEVLYHLGQIEYWTQTYARFFLVCFGIFKVLKPEPEWMYKYQLMFLREIPVEQTLKRLGWIGITVLLFKYTYVFKDVIIGLYYPSLICDLQIGKEFELGYWANKFSKEIRSKK